jgi:hypothetical protein
MLMNMGVRSVETRSGKGQSARALGALVGVWLCLMLVGCSTGTASGTITTPIGGTSVPSDGTPTTEGTPSGPTPTPYDYGTPNAVEGTTDACAQTTAAPTANLPSNIPAYPNAKLSIGSTNGGSGVFGLCASDSVDAVTTFYAAQLPTHGWQKVTNTALETARQLTASQGNINLIVTILPDAAIQGKTEVLIIYSGTPGA